MSEERMDKHFKYMKEFEELKHKNIMEEIKALGKAGITFFNREQINVKRSKEKTK